MVSGSSIPQCPLYFRIGVQVMCPGETCLQIPPASPRCFFLFHRHQYHRHRWFLYQELRQMKTQGQTLLLNQVLLSTQKQQELKIKSLTHWDRRSEINNKGFPLSCKYRCQVLQNVSKFFNL